MPPTYTCASVLNADTCMYVSTYIYTSIILWVLYGIYVGTNLTCEPTSLSYYCCIYIEDCDIREALIPRGDSAGLQSAFG